MNTEKLRDDWPPDWLVTEVTDTVWPLNKPGSRMYGFVRKVLIVAAQKESSSMCGNQLPTASEADKRAAEVLGEYLENEFPTYHMNHAHEGSALVSALRSAGFTLSEN